MTTIQARFTRLCSTYLAEIQGVSSPSSATQGKTSRESKETTIRELLVNSEKLWEDALSARLFSSNEGVEEYDSGVLELLWLPFMIADTYPHLQGKCPTSSDGPSASRAREEDMNRFSSSASSSSPPVDPVLQMGVYRQEALSRAKVWGRRYFEWMENIGLFSEEERRRTFCGVFDEPQEDENSIRTSSDGKKYSDPQAADRCASAFSRQHRVTLSRTRAAWKKTWMEWEEKWRYRRAVQKRLHRLTRDDRREEEDEDEDEEERRRKGGGVTGVPASAFGGFGPQGYGRGEGEQEVIDRARLREGTETNPPRAPRAQDAMEVEEDDDGDALLDEDSEMAEIRRERAIARLRWGCYELGYTQEGSERELKMLSGLDLQARARISKDYQERLEELKRGEATQARQTYTILPDGQMMLGTLANPQAVPVRAVQAAGGGPVGFAPPTASSSAPPPPLSHAEMASRGVYAQQVRESIMVDRNPPTKTLQEFAEEEMAFAMQQQAQERAAREAQAEEDERLGPDGVEERERVKELKWDDWKEDNPRFGKTSKGNYS